MPGGPWTLHQLRDSALTHAAEDGANTSTLLSFSGHASVASLLLLSLAGDPVELVAHGTPEPAAEMLLGMFAASRQGEFAAVDPTLTRLIGHAPTPLRDVLKAAIPTGS
jgi:hypothetical protein